MTFETAYTAVNFADDIKAAAYLDQLNVLSSHIAVQISIMNENNTPEKAEKIIKNHLCFLSCGANTPAKNPIVPHANI